MTIFSEPENPGLLFLDEDGIPVGLSSAIPSGTKLYMQKKQSFADRLSSLRPSQNNALSPVQQVENPSWIWFEPSNRNTHKGKITI